MTLSAFTALGGVPVGKGNYTMQPIKTVFVFGNGYERNASICEDNKYKSNADAYLACKQQGGEISSIPAFGGSFLMNPAPELKEALISFERQFMRIMQGEIRTDSILKIQ